MAGCQGSIKCSVELRRPHSKSPAPAALTRMMADGAQSADASLVGTATLRDRDTTQQVRLPLASLPETLAKLCSQHPACVYWTWSSDAAHEHMCAGGLVQFLASFVVGQKVGVVVPGSFVAL